MKDIVIVSATRTPIGDFGESLKDVSAVSLAMRDEMTKRDLTWGWPHFATKADWVLP